MNPIENHSDGVTLLNPKPPKKRIKLVQMTDEIASELLITLDNSERTSFKADETGDPILLENDLGLRQTNAKRKRTYNVKSKRVDRKLQ